MKIYAASPTQPRTFSSAWRLAFSFRASIRKRRASASGFSLTETLIAILLAGVTVPAIFTGLAYTFSAMQANRENLRATQIVVHRMEAIRLASYSKVQDPAAFPTNSTEYYSPSGQPSGKGGIAYTVTYNCAANPSTLPPSYRSNMVLVTVGASWKSGSVQRNRSMQSYVAKDGIQRFVSAN